MARAVLRAYGGDTPDGGGSGVRFRVKDEAERMRDEATRKAESARQMRDAVEQFVKDITDPDELDDSKFASALRKVHCEISIKSCIFAA